MTKEEADYIGAMNMCDEISNEAYTKIMCHCDVQGECGDCISRETLLTKLKNISTESWKMKLKCSAETVWNQCIDYVKDAPSVEPEIEKCEDCISRIDMLKKLNNLCNNTCEYSKIQRKSMCDSCNLDLVFDMINNAKTVEPERKTGKWIKAQYPFGKCSICGAVFDTANNLAHYCCVCGSKMADQQEREGKE